MREAYMSTTRQRIRNYLNIIHALMMHDIKNRFFGSGLGQIVMVLWPFAHIVVIIVIYYATRRPNPYGESIIQYAAVSVFPFIIFNYVSRWIVYSALTNKSFLQYPIIKPLDLLVSRAALETVSIALVGVLLIIFVSVAGFDPMPADRSEAVYATLATWFLAVGFGFFSAPIAFILPLWNLFVVLVILIAWAGSGVAFMPSAMPAQIQYPLSFNPLLSCVEWFRAAYFIGYPTEMINKTYVIECGLVMLTIGLLLNSVLKPFYR